MSSFTCLADRPSRVNRWILAFLGAIVAFLAVTPLSAGATTILEAAILPEPLFDDPSGTSLYGTLRIRIDEATPGTTTFTDPPDGEYVVEYANFLISAIAEVDLVTGEEFDVLGSGAFQATPSATSPFSVSRGLLSEQRGFDLSFAPGQVSPGAQLISMDVRWRDDAFVDLTGPFGNSPLTSSGPFPLELALFAVQLFDGTDGQFSYLEADGVTVSTGTFTLDPAGFEVVPEPSTGLLLGIGLIAFSRRTRRTLEARC